MTISTNVVVDNIDENTININFVINIRNSYEQLYI